MQKVILILGVHQSYQFRIFIAAQIVKSGIFQAKNQVSLLILSKSTVFGNERLQHRSIFVGSHLGLGECESFHLTS